MSVFVLVLLPLCVISQKKKKLFFFSLLLLFTLKDYEEELIAAFVF